GEDNSDTEPNACRTNCMVASCGDGVVDAEETCDDGNIDDTDLCTKECTVGPNFAKPLPGQVIFNELLVNPLYASDPGGEFVELLNLADEHLSLVNCVLRDDKSDHWVLGLEGAPAVIPSHLPALLTYVFEGGELPPSMMEGAPVYAYRNVLLGNQGDEVVLECEGLEIDRLSWDSTWPFAEGVAMALDPEMATAEANDSSANWCPATAPFEPGDLGSPMMPNLPCPPLAINACGVVLEDTTTIYTEAPFVLSVDLVEPGVTDASLGVDASPDLVVEVGFGEVGSDPALDPWTWVEALPAEGWQNSFGFDRWGAALTFAEPGSWAVGARVTLDEGVTWVFCDASDPVDSVYDPAFEQTIDVLSDPCLGVLCTDPPPQSCASDGVTSSQPLAPGGHCIIEDGEGLCDYEVDD
ncbi:MAG: hypothetical protein QF464_21275, partial [Myxococcota bacterium]|nr:hypothetical protein [Myxococcota bacterium]